MPLYLSNQDQERSLQAADAVAAVEEMLRKYAKGDAIRRPRIDNFLPTTRPDEFLCFSSMEGGSRGPGYYALRIKPDIISWPEIDGKRRRVTYSYKPGLYGGLVFLYNSDNAEFLAILNDSYVQHIRVAATAALGAKYMSNQDARVLGIIGSGGMARSFAMTMQAVRPIGRIQAFSPNRERLEIYCKEMSSKLDCGIVACASAKEAARGAQILSLCTNAQSPVIDADSIEPGTHVTNVLTEELSQAAFAKVNAVGLLARRTPMSLAGFVDDDFGGIRGDAMAWVGGQPAERARVPRYESRPKRYPNAEYVDCVNWTTGEPYQRRSRDAITSLATNSFGVLEGDAGASSGIQGLQFAAVAGAIYEGACKRKLGKELPREMFLQDTPT
jgi:ornithine cyclodeaminase/alanine dehydrogenase-like protein (mu-crystallin family)